MGTAERAARRTGSRRAGLPKAPVEARSLRGLLPALDAPSCEALRGFFAAPRWWLLGDGAAVQAEPAAAPASAFALDAEGTRLALHVDGPATSGSDDARLRWSDHSGRARVLAWSLAHEGTLRRLSEWLGRSLLPALDGDADGGGAATLWLGVRVEDAPDPGHDGDGDDPAAAPPVTTARLRVPADWLPALAARAEPPHEDDPPPGAGRWRELPATVSLLLSVPLALRDWRALRPGDVIVAGRRGIAPACVARASGLDWPLAPAQGGWAVQGPPVPVHVSREDPTMSDNEAGGSPPPEAPAAADPARNLPVRVEFELARTEMSVGELADLQPGYVFPLATTLEGSNVVIRANGRVAGRGELVAVGDTLGVRLLSWS